MCVWGVGVLILRGCQGLGGLSKALRSAARDGPVVDLQSAERPVSRSGLAHARLCLEESLMGCSSAKSLVESKTGRPLGSAIGGEVARRRDLLVMFLILSIADRGSRTNDMIGGGSYPALMRWQNNLGDAG